MSIYTIIALCLVGFGFIVSIIAFLLSVDDHVKKYAHKPTIGLGGPPNQKVKDVNYYGGRKSNS